MEKSAIYTVENIKKVLTSKGYPIDGRLMYPNIIGIRNDGGRVNYFDDTLAVLTYKQNGLDIQLFKITTDPGLFYLKQPMNSKGTAILKEGYYKDVYEIGKHKGHDALVQVGNFTVYRDNDKDGELDFDVPTETGVFGINLHGRYFNGDDMDSNPLINKWSAACQVPEKNEDLEKLIEQCRISVRVGNGQRFSYTLINHADFNWLA